MVILGRGFGLASECDGIESIPSPLAPSDQHLFFLMSSWSRFASSIESACVRLCLISSSPLMSSSDLTLRSPLLEHRALSTSLQSSVGRDLSFCRKSSADAWNRGKHGN